MPQTLTIGQPVKLTPSGLATNPSLIASTRGRFDGYQWSWLLKRPMVWVWLDDPDHKARLDYYQESWEAA